MLEQSTEEWIYLLSSLLSPVFISQVLPNGELLLEYHLGILLLSKNQIPCPEVRHFIQIYIKREVIWYS